MTDKQLEEYLYKVVNKTLDYIGYKLSEEDKWDLIMMELINIKQINKK
jgi:hypothetical protein